METSGDAAFELVRIGPTTSLGRAVVLQVLFYNWFRDYIQRLKARTVSRVGQARKSVGALVRGVLLWCNPRSPNFIVGRMLVAALMLRRYRMGSLKAELAYRKNFWTQLMKTALTYDEWAHAAAMLDKYNGRKQVGLARSTSMGMPSEQEYTRCT